MTAIPATYQSKFVKPDRAARQAKRAERQAPVAQLAVLWLIRQTALARLPKLVTAFVPAPVLSQTTDWCAFSPATTCVCYGEAWCDSGAVRYRDGGVFSTAHLAYYKGPEYTAEPPTEVQPVLSQTTDWPAFPPNVRVGKYGIARSDAFARGFMQAGAPHYMAEPPAPFTPFALLAAWSVTTALPAAKIDVSPLVKAAERKEAELLLRVRPENDCLHVELPAVPIVAPNGHKPDASGIPAAEHIIYPIILVDGVPETEEKQARRLASCSTQHGLNQNGRTKFYDGREAVAQ